MPVDALKGLERLSNNKNKQVAQSKLAPGNIASLPGTQIEQACAELAGDYLPGLIAAFYEKAGETLLDFSDKDM